jgi:hypothetical protein
MPVTPGPIKCGAELPDGARCDQLAVITNARYIYDRAPAMASRSDDLILNEIHYSAVCPACGERKLVEKP